MNNGTNLHHDIAFPVDISVEAKEKLASIGEKHNGIRRIQQSFQCEEYKGICYFYEGAVSFSLTNKDMDILCGGTLGYTDWFGVALFSHPNLKLTLHCIELVPASILFFPAKRLEILADELPEIYKLFNHVSSANFTRFLQTTVISFYDIKARIVYYLLDTASRMKSLEGVTPSIPVTQQQLSEISGLSRPRINEVLRQLTNEGLIEISRGKIVLIMPDKLFEYLKEVNLELYNPHSSLRNNSSKTIRF